MITLYIPVVGPSMRASASECEGPGTHLNSLRLSSVYFQIYRPTFLFECVNISSEKYLFF